MLSKSSSLRGPDGTRRGVTLPRISAPACAPVLLTPPGSGSVKHLSRAADAVTAAALEFRPPPSPHDGARTSRRLAVADPDDGSAVYCRVVVPHHMTKPGQQLFLSGSAPSLGEWDLSRAVPMEWQEGHSHVAVVRLPSSRLVQAKLVLMENSAPVFTEEGEPRDLMLMPGGGPTTSGNGSQAGTASPLSSFDGPAQQQPEAGPGAGATQRGPRMDYQVMCHFGNTEATQILRLPIVLPSKDLGDRRVLCKFVVMLDGLKLEPRQYPAIVGGAEELGNWNAATGVKLMRQVGGYWTRRVELPLFDGDIQAKVVICNADGQPAQWEPGTTNRVLAPPRGAGARGSSSMHIFVCRWSQPGHTPLVSVPVQHEDASKEYVKQLDAAQREVGVMRQAVTAKSRQVQALESDLSASRRTERMLREEVTSLRSEMVAMVQELEASAHGELQARREVVAVQEQMQQMGEIYERQVAFLEAKLVEMEQEVHSLQERLARGGSPAPSNASTNGNNSSVNGHHSSSNGNGAGQASSGSPARPVTRTSWR